MKNPFELYGIAEIFPLQGVRNETYMDTVVRVKFDLETSQQNVLVGLKLLQLR